MDINVASSGSSDPVAINMASGINTDHGSLSGGSIQKMKHSPSWHPAVAQSQGDCVPGQHIWRQDLRELQAAAYHPALGATGSRWCPEPPGGLRTGPAWQCHATVTVAASLVPLLSTEHHLFFKFRETIIKIVFP